MTVSDFILQRLSLWGVKRIFGYPGDGINGLMGAFEREAFSKAMLKGDPEQMKVLRQTIRDFFH